MKLDKGLVFTDNFYPRAADFMAKNRLDIGYLAWLYLQCELKNPNSFDDYYFSIFFAENKAEKYKAVHQKDPPPPAQVITCQACGMPHVESDNECPSCGLPKYHLPEQILLFQQLHLFPPEKREEYFRRENDVHSKGGKDFSKIKSMLECLRKEFGIAVSL